MLTKSELVEDAVERVAIAPGEEDLAAESLEPPGHGSTDPPGTDDPDGRAVQIPAHEDIRLPRRPLTGPYELLALGQPPACGEHQRDRHIRGGVGEDVRRVADRDPAGGGRGDVDVVDAHRVVGDRPQVRRGGDHARRRPAR